MKRLVAVLPLLALLAPGCSSSPGGPTPQHAAETTPAPDEKQAEQSRKLVETVRGMAGLPASDLDEGPRNEWVVFKDETTGRMLQRIPKDRTLRVVDGKLVSALLNPRISSLELVREDQSYYYVPAPEEAPRSPAALPEEVRARPVAPPEEYEVLAPSVSSTRLRFEERSEGLPTSGFWRSNMAVADLDGDGSPEIVTTPPRLSTGPFRLFRYDGQRWGTVEPSLAGETDRPFAYGGVAVHDVDGDGRPDVVSAGHGAGPIVSFNEGGLRFRIEARGLPGQMSSRAVAAGDVDGDGLADVLAISDEPESARARDEERKARLRKKGAPAEPAPDASGYVEGLDFRGFFATPEKRFVENSSGLEAACFGYTLALDASPSDGGAPFVASGCRFTGGTGLLYEFDRAGKKFRFVGRGVVERSAYHGGAATLTYRGRPAAAVSYSKVDGLGAGERSIRGQGLSVYYRDVDGWKRKRVAKVLSPENIDSQGVGTGDLNGDGLDDVVWADDSVGRVRVLFQTRKGEFEELDPELQPRFVNHSMSVKVVDVDRDGKKDIVLMYEYRTTDKTRAGGLRFFRNAG